MEQRVAVLGAGLVGAVVAADLAESFAVTAFDRNPERLAALRRRSPHVAVCSLDATDLKALAKAVEGFDLVVDALPGRFGFAVLKRLVEMGHRVVDIAFFPEDPRSVAEPAERTGAVAVYDMGLAPGMSNVLAGRHVATMRAVERFECRVGGLPAERTYPWEYKAPFSPEDVLEEYTRPARLREAGQLVVKPALSDRELVDIRGLGTLEAFNTDGLRSLLYSYSIPWMVEKTLRYPGHAGLVEKLLRSGFFSDRPLRVGGAEVIPRAVNLEVLKAAWKLQPEDEDLVVMEVVVEGVSRRGRRERHHWTLLARRDPRKGYSAMAQTTAFPCNAAVHCLAQGKLRAPGLYAPEKLGEDEEIFSSLMGYQEERGIRYLRRREVLEDGGPAEPSREA
ncbi:MAG: saccharopine dehydrogenase family protein [Acidobacteriota bacterium]